MLFVFYLIIIIFLLFFRKKQKYSWLIAAFTIVVLSITSIDYADLTNYEPLFNYYNSGSFNDIFSVNNSVWALLCKFFYSIGLNYRGMVICLLFINYYLLHKAAKNLNCNENRFFGLFLIFPSLIQLVQLKFFTAFVIIALAYSILLLNKKKSIFIYTIMVLFASLIHSSVIVFLIFLFIKKKKINKNIIFIASIVLVIIFSLNLNFITNISKNIISEQQYERYVTDTITPSSFLWIVLIFFCWFICYCFSLLITKYSKLDKNDMQQLINNKNVISINLLLLTIPLLLLDRNMHRFLEMGYVILFFMVTSSFRDLKENKSYLPLILVLCVFLIIVMSIYTPYNTVLNPLFSFQKIVDIWR